MSLVSSCNKHARVLVLSALFPPNVLGGAEMSAANLCKWMVSKGIEVGVVTTAESEKDVLNGEFIDGVRVWRLRTLRPYAMFHFPNAASWLKPCWHLQDHLDPRNKWPLRRIIEVFEPTACNIHIIQGLGYNVLSELGRVEIPATYFLHDLGLACIRMSMFKDGRDCVTQCTACKLSSAWKRHLIGDVRRIGFCSPSRANLDKLSKFFPVTRYPHAAILNANKYPSARAERRDSESIRMLYVGRLHSAKGVDLLLKAAADLARKYHFSMTVIGNGPEENRLRSAYGNSRWCNFTGFISQQEISDHMVNSDVLCIPSIWAENSPGVVVHALSLGLPVIGSNAGGIPELVKDGHTGLLVDTGNPAAWLRALEEILLAPQTLLQWRQNAAKYVGDFDQERIGERILAFMASVASQSDGALNGIGSNNDGLCNI